MAIMKLRFCLLLIFGLGVFGAFAQEAAPQNWFNLDPAQDGFPGMSTNKMYKELLKDKEGETVIVAIIDSGVDFEHEDLNMWVNTDEIPDNGIDDDKNGYVDDIHGWSFLGNKNGENLQYETLEMTRLYAAYKEKYEGAEVNSLNKKEKKEYEKYLEWGDEINKKKESLPSEIALHGATLEAFKSVVAALGKEPMEVTKADFKKLNEATADPYVKHVSGALIEIMNQEQSITFGQMFSEVEEYYNYLYSKLNYHYNPEYNARKIVGDNPNDPYETGYGNNDVKGPDAEHGTHVAGIVAAIRNNDIGMKGIADNVQIMSIRTVPNGDERDKDVANAIRYAVDNGATVINMSFGKDTSPHKDVVDKAVKYAMKNDVVLVHGSGNEGEEINSQNKFPNDKFAKKGLFGPKYAENWIEVGAINWKQDENLTAYFSNYSADHVDVFAPGMEIYSTIPSNQYKNNQGTSMASPMVAGLAATLRSYFPTLTAEQIKSIIMQSSVKQKGKVKLPGSEDELVSFNRLCVTGGIVNGYKAVQLAMSTKGKRKVKVGTNNEGKSKASEKAGKKETVRP